jgi:hypothetical protein
MGVENRPLCTPIGPGEPGTATLKPLKRQSKKQHPEAACSAVLFKQVTQYTVISATEDARCAEQVAQLQAFDGHQADLHMQGTTMKYDG